MSFCHVIFGGCTGDWHSKYKEGSRQTKSYIVALFIRRQREIYQKRKRFESNGSTSDRIKWKTIVGIGNYHDGAPIGTK